MQHDEIERLIFRILATEDEEIDCGQVFELIARYVDLEVSGAEIKRLFPQVYQHLVQCGACSELHDTLYEIAQLEQQNALPDVDDLLDDIVVDSTEPSPGIRDNSAPYGARERPALSVISSEDVAPRERRSRTGRPARRLRWEWALAAAALLIMAVLGAWGWRQASEAAELSRYMAFIANADRAVWMQGTELDPDARGYLFINETDKQGLLVIDGLDPPPQDKVYQMWIMTDSTDAVSAGTFTVEPGKQGWVWVHLGRLPDEFTTVAITPEPIGGSSKPTSSPVCVWGKKL